MISIACSLKSHGTQQSTEANSLHYAHSTFA
jgi:hypothetical protein